MPQPTGPKDPLQPPPPGIPAIETELIGESQKNLDLAQSAGHEEMFWKLVALELSSLHPGDDLEAIKAAVKEKYGL